eukprot:9213292-Karenia_brevis.AAC.1
MKKNLLMPIKPSGSRDLSDELEEKKSVTLAGVPLKVVSAMTVLGCSLAADGHIGDEVDAK